MEKEEEREEEKKKSVIHTKERNRTFYSKISIGRKLGSDSF